MPEIPQVCAVVSQPARPKGRGKEVTKSPVEEMALGMGVDPARILCPVTAKSVSGVVTEGVEAWPWAHTWGGG